MKKIAWYVSKAMDWKNYTAPARPSASELAIIERQIQNLQKLFSARRLSVAVLGCTVEYRNLAQKYGLEITLVEKSRDHYEILNRLETEYPGEHEVIFQDWRTLDCNRKFDLVLADNALNMLDREGRSLALARIKEILNTGGLFVPRTYIKVPGTPENWHEIVSYVRRKTPFLHFFSATQHLMFAAYRDPVSQFTKVDIALRHLRELLDTDEITAEEFASVNDRFQHDPVGIAMPSRRDLDTEISRQFHIEQVEFGDDHHSEYMPLHILTAR